MSEEIPPSPASDACQQCPSSGTIADVEDLVASSDLPPTSSSSPSTSNRLRSQGWYDPNADSKDHFYHRSWMQNQGHPGHLLDGTHPVIAIINTW
jgi:hypothetical protein